MSARTALGTFLLFLPAIAWFIYSVRAGMMKPMLQGAGIACVVVACYGFAFWLLGGAS